MALALTKPKSISPEAYLAQEEVAIGKREYFRGEIYRILYKIKQTEMKRNAKTN